MKTSVKSVAGILRGRAADRIAGVVLITISAAILVASTRIPWQQSWETGAGMFPTLAGAGMLFFSALLVVHPGKAGDDEDDKVGPHWLHIASFLAATIVYVALMPTLGFLISTFVYIAGAVLLLGGKSRWYTIALTGIISAAAVKYGFLFVFGVTLP